MKPTRHATGERAAKAAAALFADPATPAPDFDPVPVRIRRDGWTAGRQRTFLTVLSESGSISLACQEVGVSSRSACGLHARPDAAGFAKA